MEDIKSNPKKKSRYENYNDYEIFTKNMLFAFILQGYKTPETDRDMTKTKKYYARATQIEISVRFT